jgi:outer membrane protein assembly factor BamB
MKQYFKHNTDVMIFAKKTLYIMMLFCFFSCQKPYIKEFITQPDKPIMTANQNFARNGLQEFVFQDSLKWLYSDGLKGLPYASYLQYSGKLIFTTHNGYLYFVSLNDFKNIRKTKIADGIGTTPSIHGKTLFISINKGDEGLVAYNMATGKTKWEIPGFLSQSSPVLTETKVIHASLNGNINAYNLLDGSNIWQIEYEDHILNDLALSENNLIVAGQNGNISNYNPETGVLKWSTQISDGIYASPVVNSQFAYISSYSGSVIQIDLDSGAIKKRINTNTEIYKTPVLDNKCFYAFLANGKILALDKSNLNLKWQQQLESPFSTSPLLGSMEIIAGTDSKKLYRLNKFTGEVIQVLKLEGRPRTQPIYYKNKLYISYEPDFLSVFSTNGESHE